MVLPGATTLGAALLAQRVRCAIEQAVTDAEGTPLRVTASLGVGTLERGQLFAAHELVRATDEALYLAKRQGRNRVHIGQLTSSDARFSEPPATVTEFSKL